MTIPNNTNDFYRIGTVASLTGIAVERLRAWERRYQFSPAHKDGRTRFYSRAQLEILIQIKRLVDQGQAISSVIHLTGEQLKARAEDNTEYDPIKNPAGQTPTVGLIGANLLQLEQRTKDDTRLDIVSRWANVDAFLRELGGQPAIEAPQVLVLQLPVLTDQSIQRAQRALPSSKIITLYQFATANQISRCQAEEIATLKWPLTWAEIEYSCINEFGMPRLHGIIAPWRFSDEELIAIAADDQDPNQPARHLVEQIHQLNGLTDYLQVCANEEEIQENLKKKDKLKALGQSKTETAQARAQLENALETLLRATYEPIAQSIPENQGARPAGLSTH
jgi:DNA-binding transcriptional MerR regulator